MNDFKTSSNPPSDPLSSQSDNELISSLSSSEESSHHDGVYSSETEGQSDAGKLGIQAEHRLLNLMSKLETMQSQLNRMQTETQLNTQSVAALTQSLTDPNAAEATRERLAELNLCLADNQERLDELYRTVSQLAQLDQFESMRQAVAQIAVDSEQIDALTQKVADREQLGALTQAVIQKVADREQVESLSQEIAQKLADREQVEQLINKVARCEQIEQLEQMVANRTQLDELTKSFKQVSCTRFEANALGETKEGHVAESLKTLQELMNRREDVQTQRDLETQKQLDDSRAMAQGEVIAALLPTLDGLKLAMGSGRQMLDKLDDQQKHLIATHRHTPVSWPSIRARSSSTQFISQLIQKEIQAVRSQNGQ